MFPGTSIKTHVLYSSARSLTDVVVCLTARLHQSWYCGISSVKYTRKASVNISCVWCYLRSTDLRELYMLLLIASLKPFLVTIKKRFNTIYAIFWAVSREPFIKSAQLLNKTLKLIYNVLTFVCYYYLCIIIDYLLIYLFYFTLLLKKNAVLMW